MDFIKRLLGIETDKEWLAEQPIGCGSMVVTGHGGKRYKWNPEAATLLAHRKGYAGGLAFMGDEARPCLQELYQTQDGKFVFHFVSRRSSSEIQITSRFIEPHHFYGYMTGSNNEGWNITIDGHKALAKYIARLPELK